MRAALPAVAGTAVFFSGMFAGFLTTVLVVEATLRGYGAGVYTQMRLIELEHLDDLATALLLPAIVATTVLAVAVFGRAGRARWLAVAVVALLAATLIISVSLNVPINTYQHRWSVSSPPADWSSVRDRWQLAHVARTATAVLAFVLLLPLALAVPRAAMRPRAG